MKLPSEARTTAPSFRAALSRMVSTLTTVREHMEKKPFNGDTDGTRMKLESELSVCIQSLQFHDRLIQQLAAVRNLSRQ